MANVVSELKQALGAGARSSKYRINLNMPPAAGANNGKLINTLCNASSFPGLSIGPIEVYSQGRKLVLPGETTFETTWSVTFYQTEDHQLRKDFLKWLKVIDDFQNNKHQGDLASLMVEASVSQLDHNEEVTSTYVFEGLFPVSVDSIDVSDSQQNEIQTFQVQFNFTSWRVES